MSVHIARCRMCGHCFRPTPRALTAGVRAAVVGLPLVLGGAVAAWQRPDFLVISILGVAMWMMATYVLREPCPHCHSLRTRHRRIRYLTLVR